ncbi:hypothetical protein AD998_04185 [bacterium 336/3]|nr:hypothetical protein AD998_04185 [bacterium 336/3]
MVKSIFKSVLIGVLLGAMAFFVPVFLVSMFILFGLARLFGGKRREKWMYYQIRFAEKIRNMSEDEYTQFRVSLASARCNYQKEATPLK